MTSITITEALAEIKTIAKRIEKKRNAIFTFIARAEGIKDPLEKDGGSATYIASERQSITDLETRIIALRRGIAKANTDTILTINGSSRSIADWLTWRREVKPGLGEFLGKARHHVVQIREQAKRQGVQMINANAVAQQPTDIVINIDEGELIKEIETLEDTFGQLDGQLSLKNATVMIEVT